jgi:hypothetical protein
VLDRRFYRIRVDGRFDHRFFTSFEGPSLEGVRVDRDGDSTVLSGVCVDSSALFGVLDQIRDLGLELLELRSFEIAPTDRR